MGLLDLTFECSFGPAVSLTFEIKQQEEKMFSNRMNRFYHPMDVPGAEAGTSYTDLMQYREPTENEETPQERLERLCDLYGDAFAD